MDLNAIAVTEKDGGLLDTIDLYLFGASSWGIGWCCDCMRVLYVRGVVAMCNRCHEQGWYLIAGSW